MFVSEASSDRGRCHTPEPLVPARSVVPVAARAVTKTVGKPVPTADHEAPLFVEMNTPPCVPAKRSLPAIANPSTFVFVSPLFTIVQVESKLLKRNTPPPVPANRVVSREA